MIYIKNLKIFNCSINESFHWSKLPKMKKLMNKEVIKFPYGADLTGADLTGAYLTGADLRGADLTGNKTLKQIGVNDIEKYKKARVNKVANSSINRELNVLSKMFSIAVENKYIQINPCLGVKRLRIENKPDRFLSIEEEEKLLKAANPNLRLIILVALYTGMRQGEILNLKWKDLNLKEKYIKILKTKNNKVRKIPLAKTLEEAFTSLPRLSEYVICNPLTKTRYINIHKVFDETVKRAKIEHITFHQLRHSAATRMVEKGIDLVVVKEILGHADLSTTQKYSHPVPQRMLDAINELERYSSPISRKEE